MQAQKGVVRSYAKAMIESVDILTIGRYPIPRKIWKMNTIAVAPYAVPFVPIERSIEAMI